jgi:hypothetical protein
MGFKMNWWHRWHHPTPTPTPTPSPKPTPIPPAPVAPASYKQTYTHDFTTGGVGDWATWGNVIGAPVTSVSADGLAITVTEANQGALYTSSDAVVPPSSFIQAKVFLPGTATGEIGNWPAFWAIVAPGVPAAGEIDLVEGLGGQCAYHVHPSGDGGNYPNSSPDWHTFSALWEAGEVTFWLDNVQAAVEALTTTVPLSLKFMNQSVGAPPVWYGGPALYPATVVLANVTVWSL